MLYTVRTPCQFPPPPPTDCGANRCQVTPPQGVGGWGAVIGLRAGRSLRYFLTFADDRMGTCQEIETKFLNYLRQLLLNNLGTNVSQI